MPDTNKKKVKQSTQPCPCKIDKFEMTCGHGARKSNAAGLLEIVATPKNKVEYVFAYGPTEKLSIKLVSSITYGGEDKVSINLVAGAGCKEKIKISGPGVEKSGEFVDGNTRTANFGIEAFHKQKELKPSLNFATFSPTVYKVEAKTIAGSKLGMVKQYPSDKYEYSVEVDGLGYLADTFNKAWKKWGEKAFGILPITVTPKLSMPKGSLTIATAYKEDDTNCYVYREMAIKAGLDPLFGISIRVQISMAACVGASVGVPPPMAKLIGKHIADVLLGIEVGVESKIIGSVTKKEYRALSKNEYIGSLMLGIDGHFQLDITARLGSDYVVSVAAKGVAKIVISNENEFSINSEEISFVPKVTLKPMTLTVSVKFKAFVVFCKNKSKSWQLWKKDINIWEGDKRVLVDLAKLKARRDERLRKSN